MTEPVSQVVNVAQAEAWNGAQGSGWLQREEQHGLALRAHQDRLLAVAALAAGEQVLDVGCGTGPTSLAAARAVGDQGSVVGVDISATLLARAQEHASAEGCANVSFVVADAQVAPLDPAHFDVVLSRFGVMFFEDPVAAFTNLGRATRPGGRLAFVCWRAFAENPWLRVFREAVANGRDLPSPPEDVPGMLGLASRDHVESVLAAAGWRDVSLEAADVPYLMGPLDDAVAGAASVSLVKQALDPLDDKDRAAALSSLRAALAPHEGPDGIVMPSGVWLVTARREGRR